MNPWDVDPHHPAIAWRHFFALLSRLKPRVRKRPPVGSRPALG